VRSGGGGHRGSHGGEYIIERRDERPTSHIRWLPVTGAVVGERKVNKVQSAHLHRFFGVQTIGTQHCKEAPVLSTKDNELLTRTGPGTPMGTLLRRFWLPVLLAEELPEPDGAPVRIRIMSEDLVAFKDTKGKIGLLEAACLHRRASLFWGRNEEEGLRCSYHGWKYDVDGNCVDMPNDPEGEALKAKVKTVAYPCVERSGVIWAYMGPKELQPELPDLEWATLPHANKIITKRWQKNNWAQALEGGIDHSHGSFLHQRLPGSAQSQTISSGAMEYMMADKHPKFSVKQTEYGLQVAARRNSGENYYWRISQYLAPVYTMVPGHLGPGQTFIGHAWVPIDDENVWTFSLSWNGDRELGDEERDLLRNGDGIHADSDEKYVPIRNKDNDYLIDRDKQKHTNFTGIDGIGEQDMSVQESMGPIVDRSLERLGTSDSGIIGFRRMIVRMARELEQGKEPEMAPHGRRYRVRPATVILGPDVPFSEGASREMQVPTAV
jgi:phthalate 4,5-dioxygenase oxygenase subunit